MILKIPNKTIFIITRYLLERYSVIAIGPVTLHISIVQFRSFIKACIMNNVHWAWIVLYKRQFCPVFCDDLFFTFVISPSNVPPSFDWKRCDQQTNDTWTELSQSWIFKGFECSQQRSYFFGYLSIGVLIKRVLILKQCMIYNTSSM